MMVQGFRVNKPLSYQDRRTQRFATGPRKVVQPVAPANLPGVREVRVVEVVDETPHARSFALTLSSGAPLEFVPGQFLTVEVEIDGRRLRRAYSLSSRAGEVPAAITVKRIAGGQVSNHLNDTLRVGDRLRVLGPSGEFRAAPDEVRGRLVCIAGGSGITPIMSILRTWTQAPDAPPAVLIYGNHSLAETIFRAQLDELAAANQNMHVQYVYSHPEPEWEGPRGLLDADTLGGVLERLDGVGPDDLVLLCGPEPMMDAAKTCLGARGVKPSQIREERFGSPHLRGSQADKKHEHALISIRLGDQQKTVTVKAGQTVLEAGLDAGLALPFSCAMGGCGACRVRVVAGTVEMEEPNCLTPEEREGGYALACVGRPCGPCQIAVEDN